MEEEINMESQDNKRTFYLYKYTNKTNGKYYIGQTVDVQNRRKAHKSAAVAEEDRCPLFYRAVRKYGYDNFNFEIIEILYCTQKEADDREIELVFVLDATNSDKGYNISPGGGGRSNPNNTDTHKQCHLCGNIKLRETDFDKADYTHDGLRYVCKICWPEYMKQIEVKDKERRDNKPQEEKDRIKNDRNIKYRQEHSDDIRIKDAIIRLRKLICGTPTQISRQQRDKYKEINSKLTHEQIYNNTPLQTCGKCEKEFKSTEFYVDITRKSGLGSDCSTCTKEKRNNSREKNKEINKNLTQKEIYARTSKKFCGQCSKEKVSTEFYTKMLSGDGLTQICKNCDKENQARKRSLQSNDPKEYMKNYFENLSKTSLKEELGVSEKEYKKIISKRACANFKQINMKFSKDELRQRTPMKKCPKCEREKSSSEFYIDMTKKDGLSTLCREHH